MAPFAGTLVEAARTNQVTFGLLAVFDHVAQSVASPRTAVVARLVEKDERSFAVAQRGTGMLKDKREPCTSSGIPPIASAFVKCGSPTVILAHTSSPLIQRCKVGASVRIATVASLLI
jgi:hypothetical protein